MPPNLSLPRLIIENIIPPSDCHPRIRTVRFNLLTGRPAAQHSIEELTKELRKAAHKPGANPHSVDDSQKARKCEGRSIFVPPA